MERAISCSIANLESTSSPVAYWPVLVFLALGTKLSLLKRISPNCLGEDRLNCSPASSYTFCSILLRLRQVQWTFWLNYLFLFGCLRISWRETPGIKGEDRDNT